MQSGKSSEQELRAAWACSVSASTIHTDELSFGIQAVEIILGAGAPGARRRVGRRGEPDGGADLCDADDGFADGRGNAGYANGGVADPAAADDASVSDRTDGANGANGAGRTHADGGRGTDADDAHASDGGGTDADDAHVSDGGKAVAAGRMTPSDGRPCRDQEISQQQQRGRRYGGAEAR